METGPTGPSIGPEQGLVEAGIEKAVTEAGGVRWGTAIAYWLELTPLVTSRPRRLGLHVRYWDGERWGLQWAFLDNPDHVIVHCIMETFSHPRGHEIKVWFAGTAIQALAPHTPGYA